MINLKEHFKLTAVYTFFSAFPALLQLIVYPIIEGKDRLGAEDFGYLAITEAIISVVFIVCLFGTGNGIARLYYDNRDDPDDYKRLVSTVLSGILGRGFLLLGLVLVFAPLIGSVFSQPALQNFNEYGPALFITGINRAVIAMAVILYRHEKRLQIFIIISLLSGILRSGFQVTGVLFYDLSFIGYVLGTAIGGGIVSLGIIVFLYKNSGFHYNKIVNKNLYPFSRPLFFSDLIFWGLLFADRFFLLNRPEDLGIYDNAIKFAIGVQLIIQGLSSAIQPEFFRNLKEGLKFKEGEVKQLSNLFIAEALSIIALTIIPVMVFITVFYETELVLSASLVSIIFVRYILKTQYMVFSWVVMFTKKTNLFFFINSLVLIVCLGINWLLTPGIGYYGAIIAFLTAFLVQVIAFKIVQHKVQPIKWNYNKIFYFPLAVVLTAIILEILKIVFEVNHFITASLLVVIIFAGLFKMYRKDLRKIMMSGKDK